MTDPETILPPSSTPLERALDRSGAARLESLPAVVASLWRAETCPAVLLPYLAWALSVDEWDNGWAEDKKRLVIAESRVIHQRKGTLSAVRRALATFGQGDANIIERGDYVRHDGSILRNGVHLRQGAGGWATYRIELKSAVTIEQAKQIKRLLAAVQRNCIVLTAIDYRQAALRHNGFAQRNGVWTRGVVNTSLN